MTTPEPDAYAYCTTCEHRQHQHVGPEQGGCMYGVTKASVAQGEFDPYDITTFAAKPCSCMVLVWNDKKWYRPWLGYPNGLSPKSMRLRLP
jgi:hypothetical protein